MNVQSNRNKNIGGIFNLILIIAFTVLIMFGITKLVHAAQVPLNWDAPTQRADGSELKITEIAGYKIFLDDTTVIDVTGATTNSYMLDLSPGIHKVGMKTVDTNGLISDMSNIVDKGTIAVPLPPTVYPGDVPSEPLIIDNSSAGFSTTGTWKASSSTAGFEGTDYVWSLLANGSASAAWTAIIPTSGKYFIYAQWTAYDNRASNATYKVINNGNVIGSVSVDQRANGGLFNLLGEFDVTAGNLSIVLSNDADSYVIADAIRVEQVQ